MPAERENPAEPFAAGTTYNGIIQVHHDSSANAYYKVSQLDVATGNYVDIYPINSTDWIPDGGGDGADKVNSVALYHDTAADKSRAAPTGGRASMIKLRRASRTRFAGGRGS